MLLATVKLSISIIPEPDARNSKLLLLWVVVRKLVCIFISSNCESYPGTLSLSTLMSSVVKGCVKSTAPEKVKFPDTFKLFIFVVPFAVMSFVTSRLLFANNIFPVPLALNSKSALETVVVITLVSNFISLTFISLALILRHLSVLSPKLKVPVVDGFTSLPIFAPSTNWLPTCSPTYVKFPEIVIPSCKLRSCSRFVFAKNLILLLVA